MKMHMNADFSPDAHHPEDPRRIHEIFEPFKRTALVYHEEEEEELQPEKRPHVHARPRVHAPFSSETEQPFKNKTAIPLLTRTRGFRRGRTRGPR